MDDIKYIGVHGLEELIVLTKNGLANKADVLQFDVMPDPIKYIGKVVQYVGVSNVSFTRSHFYYSNGIKWTEENISGNQTTQIEMVTALPSWVNADPQILYILKDTTDKKMGLYVKNPSVNDSWFTVESSGSFVVVDTLPQWGDADSSTIYFKADGNILTGYIKKTGTVDAWYTLGGASQGTVDTVLSATSTNPVQNKAIYTAIQDVLAQVASVYHYKGSCLAADLPVADNKVGDTWNLEDASSYGPSGTNVAWDGTEWDTLGGDLTPDAVPTDGSQHSVMSGGVYDALLTKEDAANKVTTIDVTATDEQYPSAKAVHDALKDLEPIPPGFIQNVDTAMQPVEDGKVMRISKTAFDALAQRDQNVMYYLDEEHDLIDAKPTCRDTDGNLVKGQKIVELTKAQYDALTDKDPDTYYMINDDTGSGLTDIGQTKTGSFPATKTKGIVNSTCVLTEGTWLVFVSLLFNPAYLQGTVGLTIGNVDRPTRVRCNTPISDSDNTHAANATLVDIVTIAEGESKAVGINIFDSKTVSFGDEYYWNVRAVRVA